MRGQLIEFRQKLHDFKEIWDKFKISFRYEVENKRKFVDELAQTLNSKTSAPLHFF